jgi:CRP-like cAMP-binding protein
MATEMGSLATKTAIIRSVKSFTHLNEKMCDDLAQLSISSNYRKGDILFYEGDEPKFVFVVYQGRVKFFNSSASGKTIIARVSYGPGLAGLASVIIDKPFWFTGQALDDVKTLKIKQKDFINFINDNPKIVITILEATDTFLHGIYNRFKASVSYPVEQRVFDCIYNLYEQYGVYVPFSYEEVAGLVGTTRETVVRSMSPLIRKGIIKSSRAKITVLEPEGLHKLIKESPIM